MTDEQKQLEALDALLAPTDTIEHLQIPMWMFLATLLDDDIVS